MYGYFKSYSIIQFNRIPIKFYKQLFIFSVLLFVNLSFAGGKKPTWVKKRPVSEYYYIGIGVSQKKGESRDYIQSAKNNALNDLASEITVNISSEFLNIAIEQYGMFEEEVISQIRSSTKANLEGFELVDTWEDKNEYWVYYRLSKELYKKSKKLRLDNAISLSLDMFKKGKINERGTKISEALSYYLQSLNPIQNYIGEPLETNYGGTKIFLLNEIYSSIQSLLNHIELIPNPVNQETKIGQPLKRPLKVTAIYTNERGEKTTISKLPLRFEFIRGSGDLIEKIQTDRFGKAKCQVSKITATDKIQIVKAELDFSNLLSQDSLSVFLQNIFQNLSIPSTKFILNVSGVLAFIKSDETNLSRKLDVLYIEPALKNVLSVRGFTFIDDMSKADYIIEIKAESRRGSEMYGLYSAFVDLTISVLDMTTGNEVYKNSLQDVKGIQLNYNKAGLKALENAATKVTEEILPDLIEQIQR